MNAFSFFQSLFRHINRSNANKNKAETIDKSILEKSVAILKIYFEEKQAWKNRKLKIKDVTDELSVNRTYAWEILKHVTNHNFNDYVNTFRIEEARYLLQNSNINKTLDEIAHMVGFNCYITFSRAFKKVTGTTPTKYIEQYRKKKR